MLLYVFFVLTTAKTNTRANYTLLPAGLSTTQIVMGVLEELKKEDMVSLDDLLAPIFVSYLSFLLAIYIYILCLCRGTYTCTLLQGFRSCMWGADSSTCQVLVVCSLLQPAMQPHLRDTRDLASDKVSDACKRLNKIAPKPCHFYISTIWSRSNLQTSRGIDLYLCNCAMIWVS